MIGFLAFSTLSSVEITGLIEFLFNLILIPTEVLFMWEKFRSVYFRFICVCVYIFALCINCIMFG